MNINNMSIEELRTYAQAYFSSVINVLKETPEGSAEYDSHVEDLESMSNEMDERSFGWLKLKVVY